MYVLIGSCLIVVDVDVDVGDISSSGCVVVVLMCVVESICSCIEKGR